MKYIKPKIEELELLASDELISCSSVVPWQDDEPEQEDIPEHGVPWDEDPF